jgi:hypothetical protein
VTLIESIVRELPNLPPRKLVEVARLIHASSETAQAERARLLRETHGYLTNEEGEAFEAALATSRQIESDG